MPAAVAETWSLMLWGFSAPTTVTVEAHGGKPRSTCSGSQGDSASFSATQKLYLDGWPWVERSSTPGRGAAHVDQDQPQGPPDRGVGPAAGAEGAVAGVDAQLGRRPGR